MADGLGEASPPPYDAGPTLLDTHVLLWLVGSQERLKQGTLDLIRRVERIDRILVPVFSVWEISLLVSKGRLSLPMPPRQWLQRVLQRPAFELVPLTADIAIESNELPAGLRGDPADRIIVATARLGGFVLLTCDRAILDYAKQGHVRAIAA